VGADDRTRTLGVVTGNLALVATFLAFFTIAIRAVVVSRLNPTTAVALVQTTGPVNVLVGTLVAAVPSLVLLSAVASLLVARQVPGKPKRLDGLAFGILVSAGVTETSFCHRCYGFQRNSSKCEAAVRRSVTCWRRRGPGCRFSTIGRGRSCPSGKRMSNPERHART
jgi:hypothetical protein